jgi:hypothetical protein
MNAMSKSRQPFSVAVAAMAIWLFLALAGYIRSAFPATIVQWTPVNSVILDDLLLEPHRPSR